MPHIEISPDPRFEDAQTLAPDEPAGFIALSKFTVDDGVDASGLAHIARVKQAFRDRPHLVEDASGFRKLEVFTPRENPNEIWLLTFWDDEESYATWHKSHLYHESHKGIPKGIRLVPRSTKIEFFDHVAS
jgi:heme oxygenase (mycobilin-producing)